MFPKSGTMEKCTHRVFGKKEVIIKFPGVIGEKLGMKHR
jgi:hypothetical protein